MGVNVPVPMFYRTLGFVSFAMNCGDVLWASHVFRL